jgi:glutamate N-acetyltransferase/amino-acid N-acetyltransferase
MKRVKFIKGGVTAPAGFRATGVPARIKGDRGDISMVVSDVPAHVAGTFTTNRILGSHVKLCKARLKAGKVFRAVVVNSGNANACTGPQGLRDAAAMARLTAAELGVPAGQVLVCSTGTIGIPMPMDRVEAGIRLAAGKLSPTGGAAAARSIMTTDTVPKEVAVEIRIDGRRVRIGGMAKGAGMIEPNMATLLGFVTTDAAVDPSALRLALRAAVDRSFNCITVDGDQSPNDTVLAFANGQAGNRPLDPRHPGWAVFTQALHAVTLALALKIVEDGEGATKHVTVTVQGARSEADARLASRAIANSLLVKTSWFGRDPNWGRVIDAVGYSGAAVKEGRVDIWYDAVQAVKSGMATRGALQKLEQILRKDRFEIRVDLHLGKGASTVYTCDCSLDYVKINAEYMT